MQLRGFGWKREIRNLEEKHNLLIRGRLEEKLDPILIVGASIDYCSFKLGITTKLKYPYCVKVIITNISS
ncbi:hypothetical protein V6N13_055779 [Hibiscus sabdariffa]